MRSLCTGEDHIHGMRRSDRRRKAYLDTLMSHKLHAGAPVFSAAPIMPEERGRADNEWMQKDANLTGLARLAAIPLALLTERTGAATVNAGSVHDTQAAIGFSALLMREQVLPSRTSERSIGLQREVSSGETPPFPGHSRSR